MSQIAKLKLAQAQRTATSADDTQRLRDKLADHLKEQKALAEADIKGERYQPTRPAYVTDQETGQRILKDVPKRARRWFWHDISGTWFIEMRYGNKPLTVDGTNNAVEVGKKENLPNVIQTLIDATQNGELDKALADAKKKRQRLT